MATYTVTTAEDTVDAGDGVLSLREAVQQANATAAEDAIRFADALEGRVLTLTQGELALAASVAIDGDADDDGVGVTLSGGGDSRVLAIAGGLNTFELRDLDITEGVVADGNGGGISVGGGAALTLVESSIRNCSAGEAYANYHAGGGIFAGDGSRVYLSGCSLSGNFASNGGGAILGSGDARIEIAASSISGNAASYGGGIAARGGLSLTDSSVTDNFLLIYNNDTGRGGGVYAGSGGYVARTLIAGNGGAIGGGLDAGGLVTMVDSTVANNRASGDSLPGYGAGLTGSLDLTRCTVTGNQSSADGRYYTAAAGIASRSLRISDSIVAGNDNAGGPGDISGTLLASNGRNIFGSNVAGSVPGDLENIDPALVFAAIDPVTRGGQLALNGGPTATVALRDALDNPALGGAEPAGFFGRDQRGFARPQPEGTNPDLGAFELSQGAVSRTASAGNDLLTGTAAADTISGLAGADRISGLGAADRLFGNDGSDALYGGDGNDLLEGGLGSDWLDGGAGVDRVSYFNDAGTTGVIVDLLPERGATRGGESDRLFDIEDADGTNYADTLYGNDLANRLKGAGGVDRLYGGSGDDVLNGGVGNDRLDGDAGLDLADYAPGGPVTVDLSGSTDRATRSGETDSLMEIEGAIGSGYADTFRGDAAANLFRGLAGKDAATGGGGTDRFDYDAVSDSPLGAGRDVLTDFAHLSDDIDLYTIDARTATPAVNDGFTFLAAQGAGFTAAGQVRWYQSEGRTFVEASNDADVTAELQIELAGLKALTADDFVL